MTSKRKANLSRDFGVEWPKQLMLLSTYHHIHWFPIFLMKYDCYVFIVYSLNRFVQEFIYLTREADPYYNKVLWTIDIRVINEEISSYKQGCLSFLFLLWCQINAGNFCRSYECKCMGWPSFLSLVSLWPSRISKELSIFTHFPSWY